MVEISRTVDRAFDILAEIRATGPVSVAALANRMGASRTVVRRLLATLERHDMVRRTDRGFDIGFGFLGFSAAIEPEIRRAARPALAALAGRFAETAVLSVRRGPEAVAVDQVVPDGRVMRVHYQPGTRHRLTAAAHGRCILAALPPAEAAAVDGDLDGGLDAVLQAGYATSHDELEPGVTGLAAAVRDSRGVAVAAVGLVAPTSRFPTESEVASAVVRAAAEISDALAKNSETAGAPLAPGS